jgi:hypothetical protein
MRERSSQGSYGGQRRAGHVLKVLIVRRSSIGIRPVHSELAFRSGLDAGRGGGFYCQGLGKELAMGG